ncbi:MAG: hypothetical protein V2B19_21665 [Pseudomonadota bacterium]
MKSQNISEDLLTLLKLIDEVGSSVCVGTCEHRKPGELHCHNKGQADYYCVRCNWRGDEPESPREGESWYCCPVCRGHALPWERRHKGIAARC